MTSSQVTEKYITFFIWFQFITSTSSIHEHVLIVCENYFKYSENINILQPVFSNSHKYYAVFQIKTYIYIYLSMTPHTSLLHRVPPPPGVSPRLKSFPAVPAPQPGKRRHRPVHLCCIVRTCSSPRPFPGPKIPRPCHPKPSLPQPLVQLAFFFPGLVISRPSPPPQAFSSPTFSSSRSSSPLDFYFTFRPSPPQYLLSSNFLIAPFSIPGLSILSPGCLLNDMCVSL